MESRPYKKIFFQGLFLVTFSVVSISLGAGIKYAEIKAASSKKVQINGTVTNQDSVAIVPEDNNQTSVIFNTPSPVAEPDPEPSPEVAGITTNNDPLITPYNLDVLVDKNNPVPTDFTPNDLQNISSSGVDVASKDLQLRGLALTALKQMLTAMQQQTNRKVLVLSGFRSYSAQASLYTKFQKSLGDGVTERAAQAGFSEHQLGTAVDLGLRTSKGGTTTIYGKKATDEWKWLDQNAHKYGFVMSYRYGQTNQTGYKFEPWHWRYVGIELAKQIRFSTSMPQDSYRPINT